MKDTGTVWIVSNGEQHEGGSVSGVYDSKEKAIENALKVPCHFDGGWLKDGDDYWTNGCDYVIIEEFKIK